MNHGRQLCAYRGIRRASAIRYWDWPEADSQRRIPHDNWLSRSSRPAPGLHFPCTPHWRPAQRTFRRLRGREREPPSEAKREEQPSPQRVEPQTALGQTPRRSKTAVPQRKQPSTAQTSPSAEFGSLEDLGAGGFSFFAISSKAIAENRGPLLVIHGGAAIPAEIAFHEIARAHVPIDHGVDEIGTVIGGQSGIEGLMTAQKLNAERIANVLGKRKRGVFAASERAIEFRVVHIGEQSGLPQVGHGDAKGLIQRILLVRGGLTAA